MIWKNTYTAAYYFGDLSAVPFLPAGWASRMANNSEVYEYTY